ncbi:hypothetical protein BDV06DRAFT_205232 [Aspergillus oleicola]
MFQVPFPWVGPSPPPICLSVCASRTIKATNKDYGQTNRLSALKRDNMYLRDEWPIMPDGSTYDGKNLLKLVINNKSPFEGLWDVKRLLAEIERNLRARVVDIPSIVRGSHNAVCYGIHITLHNQPPILVRLSRTDLNHPDYSGPPPESQVSAARFESGVYKLLRAEEGIPVSQLLYYRPPIFKTRPGSDQREEQEVEGKKRKSQGSKDLSGRALFVFGLLDGRTRGGVDGGRGESVWEGLGAEQRTSLLHQCARIRASLFNLTPPKGFSTFWLRERLFERNPEISFKIPGSATRDFCIALFEAKVNATIGQEQHSGSDIVQQTKQTLLGIVPHILPEEEESETREPTFYRLVLEHGDFAIHNMAIKQEPIGHVSITSLHDWEIGHILPAILSDPLLGINVDLSGDENGESCFSGLSGEPSPEQRQEYLCCMAPYVEALFAQVPAYKRVIQAGRNARCLWKMLDGWRGGDVEGFCERLIRWVEEVRKTSASDV